MNREISNTEQYIKDREFFKNIFYHDLIVGIDQDSIELLDKINVKRRFYIDSLSMRERFVVQEFKELVSEKTGHNVRNIIDDEVFEHAKLMEKLYTDPLTKISNRLYFEEVVMPIFESTSESVLYIFDIDDFKKINDTFGHDKGDMILMLFSKLGKDCFGDDFCRYGGEEFVFVEKAKKHQAAAKADKFLAEVKKKLSTEFLNMSGEEIWEITCSCGIAAYPEEGSDFRTVYHLADSRMYGAKKSGKNSVRYADAD